MEKITKKQIHMYGYDFEVYISEKDFITGKYRVTVNYLGYPDHISIDYGYTEQEAIDRTVRKVLTSSPLEAIKNIY
ncbi:hypothetical protein I6G82_08430 [Lysinibacillus macroides]|uniref:Uncharacterized protein n=1 Tax=Lysinibacillus macroides TaxID=33935 RepID=A0A0M9DJP1_9BACI|nr:hypothetical protein [Lysinibacillus macroides]KOY81562.1 hypothetical protein ADM90_14260 [Lysinibacillus macroides]QPR69596.1 hypothetical protein I6G82_08430 [Lysinibacillus macroides]